MHCSRRLIVQTLVFSRSYLHRQVYPPQTLVVKGGTTWARNGRWILPANARLPRNIQGSFTCRKSTTWDKRLYFLSQGRRAEDFFALRPGLNPRTCVPKASTLLLDHRSRYTLTILLTPRITELLGKIVVANVFKKFVVILQNQMSFPVFVRTHYKSLAGNT